MNLQPIYEAWDGFNLRDDANVALAQIEPLNDYIQALDDVDTTKFDELQTKLEELEKFFDEKSEDRTYFSFTDEDDYLRIMEDHVGEINSMFRQHLDCEPCDLSYSHSVDSCGNPRCA